MENLENTNVETQETEGLQEQQEVKTFSQEEVLALIQKESDKRVTQALAKQQAKFEKQIKQQQSLASLDEQARDKAEAQMRIQELEERLAEFDLMQTKAEITKVLSARGMSPELVDFVATTSDVVECQNKIDTLDKIMKQMVRAEVEKRMSATTPKANVSTDNGAITKERFARMTLAEKSELARTDIDLYKQLINR